VLPETEDGRIIFIVPWRSRALIGTTDTGTQRIGTPLATDEDVEYLLAHVNRYVRRPLSPDDIIATYAGYRPLLRLRASRTPSRLSRSHAVVESAEGLLTVSGGKLTTYRRMAQDVLDRIDAREGRRPRHPTLDLLLAGARGWTSARRELDERGRALGLNADARARLGEAYGSSALALLDLIADDPSLGRRLVPDLPYLRAAVVYACRAEMALRPQDILARRMHLNIEDRSRGTDAVEDVADLMAAELGWSAAERDQRVASYIRYAREQVGPLADLEMTPPGAGPTSAEPLRSA
jgi:glycerol-3-phosphate dehydrogenase